MVEYVDLDTIHVCLVGIAWNSWFSDSIVYSLFTNNPRSRITSDCGRFFFY